MGLSYRQAKLAEAINDGKASGMKRLYLVHQTTPDPETAATVHETVRRVMKSGGTVSEALDALREDGFGVMELPAHPVAVLGD